MSTQTFRREIDEVLARREKLKRLNARLWRFLAKWEPRLAVHVSSWRITDAKQYWATTDGNKSEIWFAADLADMPPAFVEVIVVYTLAHHRSAGHESDFFALMDEHLPGWRDIHGKYGKVRRPRGMVEVCSAEHLMEVQ